MVFAGFLCAFATSAFAQPIPADVIGSLVAKHLIGQTSPPKELPTPAPGDRTFILRTADRSSRKGRDVRAEGNVRFAFKGYEAACDRATGNLDTEIFVLEGNVWVNGQSQSTSGDRVVVDFKNQTIRYEEGKSRLDPALLGGNVTGPLYVSGDSGGGGQQRFRAFECTLTSCDRDHPHFEIDARDTDIRRGKRIVMRDAELKYHGRKILRLPYLSVPINDRRSRYTPEFGQTRDEGYYVKNTFSIPVQGDSFLDSKVDYFSKLGAGLGLDYDYDGASARGLIRTYQITGAAQSRLLSVDHRQLVGSGKVRFEGNWIRNNYLTAPNSSNYLIRTAYDVSTRRSSFRLAANRNSSKTSGFGSTSEVLSLAQEMRWSSTFRTNTSIDFSKNRSSGSFGSNDRKVVNLNFRAAQQLRAADLTLDYLRSIPVGASGGFFGFSDRTPVVSVASDANRLFGTRFGRAFPLQTELSVGELGESATRRRYTRTSFELKAQKNVPTGGGSSLSYNSRFRQSLYSNDTAQYSIAHDYGYRWAFSRQSSLNLRYNYLRPFGFTPLSVDRTGLTDEFSGDLQWQVHKTFSIAANTAYDQLQVYRRQATPWQNVGVRTEWSPNERLLIRTNSLYDTREQAWSNIRLDAGWKIGGGMVQLGARYDGLRHTWGNVNILATGLRSGNFTVSALANYNGYLKRFENRQLELVLNDHCTEWIFSVIDQPFGFRAGTEFGLFLRIKALPFSTPFGFGRRGQAIGTGSGF